MTLRIGALSGLVFFAVGCADEEGNTGGVYEYDGDVPVWRLPDGAIEIGVNQYTIGYTKDEFGREIEGRIFIDTIDDGHEPIMRAKPGSCYSLLASGAEWQTVEPWVADPTNSPVGDQTAMLAQDIATWENAVSPSGADVFGDGTSDSGYDADLTATDNVNGAEWGIIDNPGTIAVTYTWGIFGGPPSGRVLVEWDQIYDLDSFTWDTNGDPDSMDFENIATHELGHALGLGHSGNCTQETMYAYASLGETSKRTLNAGDIAGINVLY